MSYALWNPNAFYNAGDVVLDANEDYQAVVANFNKQPSLNTPAVWSVLAPPGPGPSNTLAFNQPTTELEIVGGNKVDISPLVGFQTGDLTSSLPSQTNVSVGNSQANVPFVSRLQYINPTLVAPVSPNLPVYVEFDPPPGQSPPPLVRWLEAHWFKQDPNPSLDQDKYFYIETGDGFTRLGSEWAGFLSQSISLNAANVVLETGQGPNSGLLFKSGALNGNLYQDAAGDLYWNGTKLN